jgi:hypothetical protein
LEKRNKSIQVVQGEHPKPELVDKLRKQIMNASGVDLFSLTTKIFHHLNSQYPIYDTMVSRFLKEDIQIGRVNLHNDYLVLYQNCMKGIRLIKWNENDVDQFDSAVWVYVGERERIKREAKKAAKQDKA